VATRYGRFFERLDVWALRANQNHIYYLMDGIRNGNLRVGGNG
jgi:hypothetical protein